MKNLNFKEEKIYHYKKKLSKHSKIKKNIFNLLLTDLDIKLAKLKWVFIIYN
jgi:hypothetical protein